MNTQPLGLTFIRTTITAFLCLVASFSFSQSKIDSLFGKLDPQKFAASIGKKAEKMEEKLVKKSMQTLEKMQKQEEEIYKKMLKGKDSLEAKVRLAEVKEKYAMMKDKLQNPVNGSSVGSYVYELDKFNTSLKYLKVNGVGGKVKDAIAKTGSLQGKFQQAEQVKQFIKQRREQLNTQLEKLGMVKRLKQINKQVYYYAAQIKEYKEILKDPKKIEKKALELLIKTDLFQKFFKKNSLLASLFRLSNDPNDPDYTAGLAGLQTRVQVNNLVQQQIAAGGPNGMEQFQQQMQSVQSQINQLKNKIGNSGASSSDDIMPEGFKTNEQKTKSFLKRLELGTTLNTQKATNFFPTTTDLGLSVGYKLNDKSVIGVGASYKLGLGRGWEHIRFTSEGVGVRSFIDWKLKGSLWISGGYELNLKSTMPELPLNKGQWQESGLIGLSKKISVNSPFFKKTKVQLLWDFLSYKTIPRTQAIIMRFGYNF